MISERIKNLYFFLSKYMMKLFLVRFLSEAKTNPLPVFFMRAFIWTGRNRMSTGASLFYTDFVTAPPIQQEIDSQDWLFMLKPTLAFCSLGVVSAVMLILETLFYMWMCAASFVSACTHRLLFWKLSLPFDSVQFDWIAYIICLCHRIRVYKDR